MNMAKRHIFNNSYHQMDKRRIAIITFFHTEASLCLSKYMAIQGTEVDCYVIADIHHDKGFMPGIEYQKATKFPGIVKLTSESAPELVEDSNGISVTYYLLRIISFSSRLLPLNNIVFKRALKQIRNRRYDAINIVGQWPWVSIFHDGLKDLNITHTFHEIGNHEKNELLTPLLESVIRDRSKVILLSKATKVRFESIPGADLCKSKYTPMGCFYTLLLYQKDVKLDMGLDLQKPTFLFYGFLKPYKGLDLFEKACRLMDDIQDQFNVIVAGAGSDPSLPYFQSRINCYVLNRYLSDQEMLYLNKISHVVVLPYKTASQSGIIPTSFMFGNPIIATNVGALAEAVTNGVNGFVVAPNDAEQFASAMRRIIENKSTFESLRKGALKFGHGDEYDWNNIAKETIDYLLENE